MQRQILHIYTYHDMDVFLSTIHIIFIYTLVYQYDDMSETTCIYIYIHITWVSQNEGSPKAWVFHSNGRNIG